MIYGLVLLLLSYEGLVLEGYYGDGYCGGGW